MTQACAGAPQIMKCKLLNPGSEQYDATNSVIA
jgi:hypothetical protein